MQEPQQAGSYRFGVFHNLAVYRDLYELRVIAGIKKPGRRCRVFL
jgi:hypothetical protein